MQVNIVPPSVPGNRAADYLRNAHRLHDQALSEIGANLAWAIGKMQKAKGPDAIFNAFAALECVVERLAVFDPVGHVDIQQAAQFKKAAQKATSIIEEQLSDRRSRVLVRCGFAATDMLLDAFSDPERCALPERRRVLLRQWLFLAVRLLDAEERIRGIEAAYSAESEGDPENLFGSHSAKLIPFPARLLARQRERDGAHG